MSEVAGICFTLVSFVVQQIIPLHSRTLRNMCSLRVEYFVQVEIKRVVQIPASVCVFSLLQSKRVTVLCLLEIDTLSFLKASLFLA